MMLTKKKLNLILFSFLRRTGGKCTEVHICQESEPRYDTLQTQSKRRSSSEVFIRVRRFSHIQPLCSERITYIYSTTQIGLACVHMDLCITSNYLLIYIPCGNKQRTVEVLVHLIFCTFQWTIGHLQPGRSCTTSHLSYN